MQPTLILASSSPYRASLLSRLGMVFTTQAPEIDETAQANELPTALVQRLAIAKASKIAGQFPDAFVIGSDQVATIEDKILGKPGAHPQAVAQLQQLSGKRVVFHTGLCLINNLRRTMNVVDVEYAVIFRELTQDQIERYLHAEKPYDCAGSFKSEGLGITLFEKMEGDDPTALIGLPLIQLTTMLRNNGFTIPLQ